MTAVSSGLIRYESKLEPAQRDWQDAGGWSEMDMAASALAAAALQGGMPKVAAERDLTAYLAGRNWDKRRTAVLKLLVVFLAEVIGVAAGLYIGALT